MNSGELSAGLTTVLWCPNWVRFKHSETKPVGDRFSGRQTAECHDNQQQLRAEKQDPWLLATIISEAPVIYFESK